MKLLFLEMKVINKYEINILYSELKKINLAEFIAKETSVSLNRNKDSYSCLCPMPFHKDSKPSFYIYKDESGYSNECWMYHCFGCNSGGTIIDFCMDYRSLEWPSEAILYLVEKLEMKDTHELIMRSIKEAKLDVNLKKKLNSEHFLASKKCFQILKKYTQNVDIKEKIYNLYKKMNIALSQENLSKIEKISNQVTKLYNNPNLFV